MDNSGQTYIKAQNIAAELSASSPKIIALSNEIANKILYGIHSKRKAGTGDDFWQYRELGFGETAARIDWRKTARGDGFFIKEKESLSPKRFQFWVDNSPKMNYSSQSEFPLKNEVAFALAIGLFRALTDIDEHAEILGQNKQNIQPQQLLNSFQRLGKNPPAPNKNGDVVLISDGLNDIEYWQKILGKIKSKFDSRIFLIIINDPAEIEFNFQGRVIFQNELDQIQIEDCGSIKNDYLAKIRNHFLELSEMIGNFGGQIYFHNTSDDILPLAIKIWQNLANNQKTSIRGGTDA